jgi:hypothetical protein
MDIKEPKIEYYYIRTRGEGYRIYRQTKRTAVNVELIEVVDTLEEARSKVDLLNERLYSNR